MGGNWLLTLVGDNLLVAIGWWQLVGAGGGRREEEGGADTTLKTKIPHVNVGNLRASRFVLRKRRASKETR